MSEGLDLGGMLSKIAENPEASAMLRELLSQAASPSTPDGEASAVTEGQASEGEPSAEKSFLPIDHKHGRGRREMLLCLRPYLGARRSASLDRMIRALELYEILKETNLLKGDRHV